MPEIIQLLCAAGGEMRSEQVFRARKQIQNGYLLCRLASRTTRRLHFASANIDDAIVEAFERMGLDRLADEPVVLRAAVAGKKA
jgi:hypothetical protein